MIRGALWCLLWLGRILTVVVWMPILVLTVLPFLPWVVLEAWRRR